MRQRYVSRLRAAPRLPAANLYKQICLNVVAICLSFIIGVSECSARGMLTEEGIGRIIPALSPQNCCCFCVPSNLHRLEF
jgi:hypothetical protein